MSRQNKVNPDHYTLAGRLTPDDLARERWKQAAAGGGRRARKKPMPPWMVEAGDRQPGAGQADDANATRDTPSRGTATAVVTSEAPQTEVGPGRQPGAKKTATATRKPSASAARKTKRAPARTSAKRAPTSAAAKAARKSAASSKKRASAKSSRDVFEARRSPVKAPGRGAAKKR